MFRKIKSDGLIRGGFALLLMIGMFNFLNYVFQIAMARMLEPADYSILAVLISIGYIFGIPNEAIQTIITKYASKFNIKKENGKMKDVFYRSLKKGFIFSLLIFAVFIILSFFLTDLLKINFWLLALTGLLIFYVFSVPIIRGVLQGKKKFWNLGLNMVIESFIKVLFAIILVLIGWRVYGAMIGVLVGGIAAFFIAFAAIKDVTSSRRKKIGKFNGVYRYNLPVLVGITSIVLMYSLDVIIARIFFSPELAGKYAFISLIGKAILFSSFAVSKTMFPLSSESFEKGKKTIGILKKSVLLILAISVFILLLCFLAPEKVIKVISLGSSQYLDASNILFIVSAAFSFTALTNILITYALSINKIRKISLSLLIFVLMEAGLLGLFHSNLIEFSISLLVVNFLMFLYSLWLIKKK